MKISVIVPIYNVEKYLKKCLDSIVNQTYKNLEIILVNDGTKDSSGEIAVEFAEIDKRIIIINQENAGLSAARNSGIEISTGDYISFIDSDDYVSLNYFELLARGAKEFNADIVTCPYEKFTEDEIPKKLDIEEAIIPYTKKQVLDIFHFSSSKPNNQKSFTNMAWAKLYKRKIFNSLRYPVGRVQEDDAVAHVFYHEADVFAHVKGGLYYYLQRPNSIMGERSKRNALDQLSAYEDRVEYLQQINTDKKYQRVTRKAIIVTCLGIIAKYQDDEFTLKIAQEVIKKYRGGGVYCKLSCKMKMAYLLYKISKKLYMRTAPKFIKG